MSLLKAFAGIQPVNSLVATIYHMGMGNTNNPARHSFQITTHVVEEACEDFATEDETIMANTLIAMILANKKLDSREWEGERSNVNRAISSCSQVAYYSKRNAGNNIIASEATCEYLNEHLEGHAYNIKYWHTDQLTDKEMIASYASQSNEIDAGIIVAKLPDGLYVPCLMEGWENYFHYMQLL
jgi:hypothetical protein